MPFDPMLATGISSYRDLARFSRQLDRLIPIPITVPGSGPASAPAPAPASAPGATGPAPTIVAITSLSVHLHQQLVSEMLRHMFAALDHPVDTRLFLHGRYPRSLSIGVDGGRGGLVGLLGSLCHAWVLLLPYCWFLEVEKQMDIGCLTLKYSLSSTGTYVHKRVTLARGALFRSVFVLLNRSSYFASSADRAII
jgi:hypothetical protein